MRSTQARSAALDWVRRIGATRFGVLAIGHLVGPVQRRLYGLTGGRLSITGTAPVLLLTTREGGTGPERTVPLLYLEGSDDPDDGRAFDTFYRRGGRRTVFVLNPA